MLRYLVALIVAGVVTFMLFLGMQALITGGEGAMSEPVKGNVLDFVRLKKEETVQKKERKPQKPPTPKEPPPPMESPQMQNNDANAASNNFDFGADVGSDVDLAGGLALETSDGEYLPIVKVAPVYPRRAVSRGIEGYVIVEFTVTKQGAVRDPIVVEANPSGIFEQAAIDAAMKFKYKPRVVNGEATEVSGVQNRITFQIDG
nr:energy transducer TonB [Alteromonas macleodii]